MFIVSLNKGNYALCDSLGRPDPDSHIQSALYRDERVLKALGNGRGSLTEKQQRFIPLTSASVTKTDSPFPTRREGVGDFPCIIQ